MTPDGTRPLIPNMRLDELLTELRIRLEAILATRDRMHSLLEAVVLVGSDLDLETVLHRIVETATTLVDAGYGALGLVGEESELDFRKYDLCWPSIKLIVEYDGRQHVEREDQWESDIGRREKIDDDGWRILVFIAKDIYNTPGNTLKRIHRQLVARRLPGVSTHLSPQWQLHFPGRP